MKILQKTGRKPTHGHRHRGKRTPEYIAWDHMMQRCYNPNAENYKNYGGRGIKVCERWHKFENFLSNMGLKPGKEYSLDKRENNEDYELKNCRWATQAEQQNNRRGNVLVTHNEKTMTVSQWAIELGISKHTISSRVRSGMDYVSALTKPVEYKFSKTKAATKLP